LKSAHSLTRFPGREVSRPPESATKLTSGYWGARSVLSAHGIAVPRAVLVRQRADLHSVHDELKGPFVLKAGWLEHKSEHRGIVLGLPDVQSLEAAYDEMAGRLGAGEFVVEEHDDRDHIVEVLIGA